MSATETAVDAPEIGLRELKKQMTHAAIAHSAFRLTLEKGIDQVTIEEIARDAVVSTRTFSNYYSSKEEAVVSAGWEDRGQLLAAFAAAVQEAPPLQALCRVLSDLFESRTAEQLDHSLQLLELVERHPSLMQAQVARFASIEADLREAVAAHTGTDVEADMYPWLVAAAAMAGLQAALRLWAPSGRGVDHLVELIQEAFNQVSAGLPVPAR
ncbi:MULTISPECIES: TetR/AcrR family transcriptional regulator [unclassified Isoptericola]|uniref:TetR/AcrR family transcriptional regulator n=1 Tax=Isoptericola sp. NPDC057191 TaxID=3346041 RepID=UPI00363A74F8